MSAATTAASAATRALDIVVGVPALVRARARALDLGVGDGRNALHLARHGLDVDAFDAYPDALDEVTARATSEGLVIHPIAGDLATCSPVLSWYDAVVCTHVLHFLQADRGLEVLTFLAADARAPRVQALGVIARGGDFSPLVPERFFVEPGELEALYARHGWHIEHASEKDCAMIARHPDGRNMRNVVAYLLAWR